MYKKRQLIKSLKLALSQFPAVLLTGPRQSGKTTFLTTELGKKYHYASFDDPLNRSFAIQDPNGFLDQFGGSPVILDEIQYVPELMSYLKLRIDNNRNVYGQWILTGSQQFVLMQNVNESLAGRIALLELLPFSLMELECDGDELPRYVWSGGYPEPALEPEKRDLWMSSYIRTYIERDIRLLQNIRDIRAFDAFIALCAAGHGQVFNKATLARSSGVSEPTVKSWAGLLSASYVCHFLPPYFKNYGKRVIKTPKLYFIDSGLACALTRQPDGAAAVAGQMGGSFLEGLIVSEAVKVFAGQGKVPELYFWRSHDGLEVDLIIRANGYLYPIEIKLTATPTLKHLEPLDRFKALAKKDAAETGLLVCRVARQTTMPNNNIALPWQHFSRWLSNLIEQDRPDGWGQVFDF